MLLVKTADQEVRSWLICISLVNRLLSRDRAGGGLGVLQPLWAAQHIWCIFPRGPLIFFSNVRIPDDETLAKTWHL